MDHGNYFFPGSLYNQFFQASAPALSWNNAAASLVPPSSMPPRSTRNGRNESRGQNTPSPSFNWQPAFGPIAPLPQPPPRTHTHALPHSHLLIAPNFAFHVRPPRRLTLEQRFNILFTPENIATMARNGASITRYGTPHGNMPESLAIFPATPPPRDRTTAPRPNPAPYWPAQGINGGPNILWDDDEDARIAESLQAPPGGSSNVDPFLAALADQQFSSPSTYPSFITTNHNDDDEENIATLSEVLTSIPPAASLADGDADADQYSPARGSGGRLGAAPGPSSESLRGTAPRYAENPSTSYFGSVAAAATAAAAFTGVSPPERSETQLTTDTNTTLDSQNTSQSLDSPDLNPFFDDTPASSFDENMPVTRRRAAAAAAATATAAAPPQDGGRPSKRRRTSANSSNLRKSATSRAVRTGIKVDLDDDDTIFDKKPPRTAASAESPAEDLATIDLTEATEVPEELKKPREDKRIKLFAFQCVICMDDCTELTVTHCGHMYCAQCLHSSLHVDATKGKCPMCRQKLDMKAREQYNTKTKGFWPLEIKLMTATRRGKRKARADA